MEGERDIWDVLKKGRFLERKVAWCDYHRSEEGDVIFGVCEGWFEWYAEEPWCDDVQGGV